MNSPLRWHKVFILLLGAASTSCAGFSTRSEYWSEDAVLSDGRVIKVERRVDYTFQFVSGDEASMSLFSSWPDRFYIWFKHPDTRQNITWRGEQYYNPVLLDIVDGVPYLVVNGRGSKKTEAIYGCPELPYIYLKYESGFFGKWTPVPVEKAPDVLRKANLSPKYPDFGQTGTTTEAIETKRRGGRAPRDLSPAEIQMKMSRAESGSGGFFQQVIPRTYQEWKYMYKNEHRNERKVSDCRPPLQPLPDVPLPKPVDVELETVESTDYIVKGADEYYKSLSERKGTIIRSNCSKIIRPPSPENLMLGERFINDPTGNIRLPYSGPTPFPSGRMLENRAERYCDDKFVWFVAGHEELGKTIITKYTASGDLLYNIRMDDPKTTDIKLARSMVLDSITVENGYFYFYWVQSLPRPTTSSMAYPNRITKFRFREPVWEAVAE